MEKCEQQTQSQINPAESVATKRPLPTKVDFTTKPPGNQHQCRLKPDSGECRVAEARFYYNSEEGICQLFTYGGCGGNENNFIALEDCENSCLGSQETCSLPPIVGDCNHNESRWYFDAANKRCTIFNFGGCNGNLNNFATIKECQERCDVSEKYPITELPIELFDVSLSYINHDNFV